MESYQILYAIAEIEILPYHAMFHRKKPNFLFIKICYKVSPYNDNVSSYNDKVPSYNDKVSSYNDKVPSFNNKVPSYNETSHHQAVMAFHNED